MFVIELIYKASLAEIDALMAAHVTFLRSTIAVTAGMESLASRG
jgi:hypothetical protein